jgi:hypothetical protein
VRGREGEANDAESERMDIMGRVQIKRLAAVGAVVLAAPFAAAACDDDDPVTETGGAVTDNEVDDTIYDEEYSWSAR